MGKYSKKLFIEIWAVIVLVNIVAIFFGKEQINDIGYLSYQISADRELELEVFYSDSQTIAGENISTCVMRSVSEDVKFQIDAQASFLRIDLGKQPAELALSNILLLTNEMEFALPLSDLKANLVDSQEVEEIEFGDTDIIIKTNGSDPYLLFDISSFGIKEELAELHAKQLLRTKIITCVVFDVLVLLIFFCFPGTFTTPFEVVLNRNLLFRLAQNDFKTRYAGSYFGLLWAFVQPCVTIVLYWFVFQIGLGAGPVEGHPFVIWLVAGLVPWLFFQDAVLYGTNSLIEYSYLVKKVVFEVDILPMVKIISAFFVHVFFLGISLILYAAMGYFPGLYCFQMLYYSLCAGILAIALSYCTSAIVLFFRDLGQIINIVLQIGTWMTPIMWQINIIPANLRWIFKLNPMFYVVQGYRDCVLSHVVFLERLGDTAYFWIFVMVLFVCGNGIFQRLKPHFADVL